MAGNHAPQPKSRAIFLSVFRRARRLSSAHPRLPSANRRRHSQPPVPQRGEDSAMESPAHIPAFPLALPLAAGGSSSAEQPSPVGADVAPGPESQSSRPSSTAGATSSTTSSDSSSPAPPRKKKAWKRQYLGTWSHTEQAGLKSPKDMAKAEFGEVLMRVFASVFAAPAGEGARAVCESERA